MKTAEKMMQIGELLFDKNNLRSKSVYKVKGSSKPG